MTQILAAVAGVVTSDDRQDDHTTTHLSPPTGTILLFPATPDTSRPQPPGAPPPPRTASLAPSTFTAAPPDPDAPWSLHDAIRAAQSRNAAGAREKVALYGFPCYVSTNLRRVLSRDRSHRLDYAIALACLLERGLLRYQDLPAAKALSASLTALDTDDTLSAIAGEQLEVWRRGFHFSISDPTHTMGLERCRGFRAPDWLKSELHDLAGRLGLSASGLGTVAVMAALEDQEGVIGEHAAYMRGVVEDLDGRLEERGRRLQGLARAIEAGVWR